MFGFLGSNARKKKIDFARIADVVGGSLREVSDGGGGHLDGVRQRIEAGNQAARRKQLLAQATQGLPQQQAALAQLNPQAFTNRQINNTFQNPLAVQAQNNQNQLTQNTIQNTQHSQGLADQRLGLAQQAQQNQVSQFEQNHGLAQDKFAHNQDRAQIQDQQFAQKFGADQANQRFQQDLAQRRLEQSSGAGANIPPALAYKIQKDEEAANAAAQDAERSRASLVSDLSRLREGGDLSGSVGKVYGATLTPFFDKIPGTSEATVRATVDKITSNLTLDKIKNFKGAISDKDLEIAQSAATTLQRRNITDAEARREIDRLFNSLNSGSETQQENPAQAGGEWTEANQAELDALEREYGHLLGG